MLNAYIDISILACPPISEGQERYEDFILSLLNWKELANCDWISPYLLRETPEILATLGKYPLWDNLKLANSKFGIDYIDADSVMKLVTSFLQKFPHIEDSIEIEAIDFTDLTPSLNHDTRKDKLLISSLDLLLVLIGAKIFVNKERIADQILISKKDSNALIDVSYNLTEIIFYGHSSKMIDNPLPLTIKYQINIYENYAILASSHSVTLSESTLLPEEKSLKLSGDHHGNDTLRPLAQKLLRSKYVLEIINNLEFQPYSNKFINNIHADGTIDICLTRTDQGYSMRIKTTGTNIVETTAISQIIQREFEDQY